MLYTTSKWTHSQHLSRKTVEHCNTFERTFWHHLCLKLIWSSDVSNGSSCIARCVLTVCLFNGIHSNDVIMGAITSQITSLTIVYSTVHPDTDQRKHQSSTSLAFVREIHRGPVNSPHKWPVTRKMFSFHDVIMFRSYNIPKYSWKLILDGTLPKQWIINMKMFSSN